MQSGQTPALAGNCPAISATTTLAVVRLGVSHARKLTAIACVGLALHRSDKLRVIRRDGSASVEGTGNGKVWGVPERDARAFPGGPSGRD
ncbi:MAG: hypothetical protein IOC80_06665 [Rhodobacter sp.]|nr:hypothetical protein [Rhodobacter sp.]MCA3513365.1 hypothetical protein [Rhodobacter sp.]MCA3520750.1 hypothetical protein [Rhodobacter sp.]MCA3522833.1 hypothetical protein [Rhodobacter sp.]MCA3526245.1 hypothetical protein [Rhodobacter sp.]